MATRKQMRRQEKIRRHGLDRPPERKDGIVTVKATSSKTDRPGRSGKGAGKAAAAGRGRKPTPYPTVQRALRRAPIFLALWVVILYFLRPDGQSVGATVVQGVAFGVLFVPMMYLGDRFTYRMALKRGLPVEPAPPKRGS